MSSSTIRDLLVKLGVDAKGADKDIAAMDSALSDLKDVMQAVVVVGAAVTAAIAGVALSAAKAGDAVAKGAQRTALSTDAYQELAYAAELSGVSLEFLEKSVGMVVASTAKLAEGNQAAIDTYAALGLTLADLQGLSPDEQYRLVAESIANVTDESERLRLAQLVYGAEMGAKLLPMLEGGAAGMDAAAEQAHALGLVMSEDATQAAVLFKDTLTSVWGIVTAVKNEIGVALLPTLTDLMVRFRDWVAANRALISTKIEVWAGVVTTAIGRLTAAAEWVDQVVTRVFGGWGPILAAAAAGAAVVGAAIVAIGALKAWAFISGAITFIGTATGIAFGKFILLAALVVGAIVGIALAIDDLVTYFNGGDSALGRFLDRFRESDGVLGAMARRIEQVIGVAQQLWAVVGMLGNIWWAVFSQTALPALQALGAAVMWLGSVAFAALGWWWDNVVGPVFSRFSSALDTMLSGLGKVAGLLGIDLSTGDSGAGATPGAPAGAGSAGGFSSAAFAPTAGEATGGGAYAMPGAASTTSVVTEGNTYTINGVGWTERDLLDLISRSEAERARHVGAALAGAEV